MTDYIKREDAINVFCWGEDLYVRCGIATQNIKDIPSADVVPKSIYEQTKWERDFAEKRSDDMSKLVRNKDIVAVVRCKDCKHHRYQDGIPYCSRKAYGWGWKDDDYCSFGERAES